MATVKRALLIGPSYPPDLPKIRQLEGVQNDLRLMRDMLSRNGFHPENIMELGGDEASRDNILHALDKLSTIAEEKSVVVIYFSGHGWQLGQLNDEKFDNTDSDSDYFDQGILPAGLTKEMVDEYHIYDECITGEHFKPHLLKLIKNGCLVNTIFDCCFSGRMYRGFEVETDDTYTPAVKQVSFSKEYNQELRKRLKARGKIQPTEHADKRGHCQETQPPSPMHQNSRLKHPAQEFWTPLLCSQGWTPSDNDKFISIAASSPIERAFEFEHPDTKVKCGRLTSALVEVVDEAQSEGKRISYNILKSQIKRRFAEKNWKDQTPQFESGDMNLALFDFDRVKQLIAIEICESRLFQGFTKVVLNAGKLHGVVDGEYDVYPPDVTDDEVKPEMITRRSIDTIIVNPGDVDLLTSRGATLFKRDGILEIVVGCKAVLRLRHSMCTPIIIKLPDFPLQEEHQKQIKLAIENQGMFVIENEERADTITLDVQIVEEKNCWRACQYGRMIAPYQEVGDEHLMMKNLSKYFRYKFAIEPKFTNHKMLEHVSFKLFKIENVPSYKGSKDKKTELIADAIKTEDLYGDQKPRKVTPTFRAHKVEQVKSMYDDKKYKVIDGSGDAMVIQVTNKENMPIHVCVVSYQADGSIVILHPPKNGDTEVLKPGESTQTIKRILLQPDTVSRMVEPDFDKPKPEECTDVLILYATSKKTNYEPLTQTAIELSPKLSTRGPDRPDGLRLEFADKFRQALRPRRDKYCCARDDDIMWLTIRRDIRILYNQDPDPPASSPEPSPFSVLKMAGRV